MPRIRSRGTVQSLQYREIGIGKSPYRSSLKILRLLICDQRSTFTKIWETHSKSPIAFEDGHIYLDNYRTCLALCGINSLPSPLYKLPQEPKNKKIEDALVYTGPLAARSKPRVLITIAVFAMFPLQFKGMLEIDRAIFGKECNHANVSEGLLIVGTGSTLTGAVRLYNFRNILEEACMFSAKLYEPCLALDGAKVGTYPAGLPLNCKLKEPPPVLFEVKCSEFMLHFGCYPWHYICSPPSKEGVFQIKSVESDELAENGLLDFPNSSTEPDSIAFHPDDSGRIVYNSSHFIKVFRLITNKKNKPSLKECFEITFREQPTRIHEETNNNKPPQRKCKTLYDMHSSQCVEKSLLSDDYENELELYSVLGFDPRDESCMGKVGIYDNETGHRIKSFELGMSLDELCDYTLTLDLDTVVVLVKDERRNFSCYLYRLHYPGLVDVPRSGRYSTRNTVLRRSQRSRTARITSNNGVVHDNYDEDVAVPSSSRSDRVLRSTRH
ncbi:DDB1- and CUL4-associated factor 17 isoform X2 [Dermacentor silvarum]|uniref:DDB1- and CUL4-associated factor 17 isoform X2 n=1 Tax=Dermacentor silvarum TaxID=543639 RepID=UPI002100DDCB|nr:DDB1- and CUL4-associated factor 17 isoform X2 [Dermacentor silvarum]